MRLGGAGGAVVDLRVVGFEFAVEQFEPELNEWDVNWPLIAGRVRFAGGATWTFRAPGVGFLW